MYDLIADPDQWTNVANDPEHAQTLARLDSRLLAFFARHVDARYDLWSGGTGQAMFSRYLLFKKTLR